MNLNELITISDLRAKQTHWVAIFGLSYAKVRKATGPCPKRAKVRRLFGFRSPILACDFGKIFWGWNADRVPQLFIGEIVFAEQVDVVP